MHKKRLHRTEIRGDGLKRVRAVAFWKKAQRNLLKNVYAVVFGER